MEIFPQITRKQLGDCKPGELVRLRWGDVQPYALLATNEEYQFLAFLSDIGDREPPVIALLERPDLWAVSYGTSFRIDVDQGDDNVDLAGNRLWDKSGALMVQNDHYVMRLRALPQSRLAGSHYLRLDTGTLGPDPAGSVAIFGKWSLMLPMGGDEYEPLLTIG